MLTVVVDTASIQVWRVHKIRVIWGFYKIRVIWGVYKIRVRVITTLTIINQP